MSITLGLRGGSTFQRPLSTSCLGQIERLRVSGACGAIELLFGDEGANAGDFRTVPKQTLLESVKELRRAVKKLPGGFQIHVPPFLPGMQGTISRGGGSGLQIGGNYYSIRCELDYWTLESIDDMRAGKEPVPRYEAADILTENLGVFRVEPRKSARSDLSILLHEVQAFLEGDQCEAVQIVWG